MFQKQARDYYRCSSCQGVWFYEDIIRSDGGGCPACDYEEFRGTRPTKWEYVKCLLRYFLRYKRYNSHAA